MMGLSRRLRNIPRLMPRVIVEQRNDAKYEKAYDTRFFSFTNDSFASLRKKSSIAESITVM